MARFYFHLDECGSLLIDPEGRDLPCADTARAHAVREARHVISFDAIDGRLRLDCAIVVEDHRRREVLRMPFREAVAVISG